MGAFFYEYQCPFLRKKSLLFLYYISFRSEHKAHSNQSKKRQDLLCLPLLLQVHHRKGL